MYVPEVPHTQNNCHITYSIIFKYNFANFKHVLINTNQGDIYS
jgi:hypothetical protein